jgi:hypothetical protein
MSDSAIRIVMSMLVLGIVFGIHGLRPGYSLHCSQATVKPSFCGAMAAPELVARQQD